jgi:hypothetical protein
MGSNCGTGRWCRRRPGPARLGRAQGSTCQTTTVQLSYTGSGYYRYLHFRSNKLGDEQAGGLTLINAVASSEGGAGTGPHCRVTRTPVGRSGGRAMNMPGNLTNQHDQQAHAKSTRAPAGFKCNTWKTGALGVDAAVTSPPRGAWAAVVQPRLPAATAATQSRLAFFLDAHTPVALTFPEPPAKLHAPEH